MYRQSWHGLVAIATLGSFALANPLTYWNVAGNASLNSEQLMTRDTAEFDSADLSFIKRMAAIGDSYSAGIGAGQRLDGPGDFDCRRFDHSYPYLINNDERLGDPAARTFQFQSCSGAVVDDVLKEQIPNIDENQQVILLSAGGNDAELTNILNQCIFQWSAFKVDKWKVAQSMSLTKQALASLLISWESMSRGCEGQLTYSKNLIAGNAFSKSLDSIISAAKSKLASDGMIYYTGYAKFFAEDLSSACDDVSWSIFIHDAGVGAGLFEEGVKLTTDHRKIMNDLVDDVNAQISAAVKRAGDRVKFVDYDQYVGHFNGRFCENGVDESTKESNTRNGLMFYEMNTWDFWGTNPWKRSVESSYVETFEGSVNQFAQITLELDPGAKLSDASFVSDTSTASSSSLAVSKVALMSTTDTEKRSVPWYLPDGYGRVFHPQILLHELISSLVVYNMVNKNEQDNGLPAIPETIAFDSCPNYPSSSSNASSGQQIAVASYINPLSGALAWLRLTDNYSSDKMPILVANVVNGPDSTVNDDWAKVIKRAAASGKKVLGYVRTGYLGVSDQRFTTRLGSVDLADWTAQIEEDVDMWYNLYGDDIGGIFFDEGWPECGADNKYVDLYKYINDYTKRTHPGAYTVLNPGSPIMSCFEDTMDTLLTFELSYDAYIKSYTPNDWVPKDPRKLWHIIYNVPESAISEVIALSKKRGAGFVQLTDDIMPNPYDDLPADSYIKKMLGAVHGGSLLKEAASSWQSGEAAGAVSGLRVETSEYTSARLSWYPAGGALGYHVYSGTTVVASVPNTMTQITLGGLTPGTSHDFHVSAVGGGGHLGSSSSTVTVVTDSLPSGKTVTNWHSTPQEGSTTIKADILVPYAFVRLYLWDSVGCDFDTNPGWTVNFKIDKYVCTHYMIEGTSLYNYTGTVVQGSTTPPWAWTLMSAITLDITGYTYTWTLPIGTLTTDTSKFVIQTQGYNALGNFVEPDASDYDCEGSTMCSTPGMLKWCDHAVNYLHRDDDPFYNTNGAASQTGNCWGDQTRGCGVFVQGINCSISGNDMWNDYQNIRKIGGCGKCGTYHRGNGCLVTIDYVYQCNNHD